MPNDDEFDDGIDVEEHEGLARIGAQDLKSLRGQAKKGRKVDALERENAMLKAGLDPDDARHAFFMKGYDGDLDKESVVQAATELGFLEKVSASTPDPSTQQEDAPPAQAVDPDLAAISSVHDAAASAGAEASQSHQPPDIDPYQAASAEYDRVVDAGGRRDDAGAAAFAAVTQAGLRRDPRVVVSAPATDPGAQV